jgi:DnaK suppressor protein
MSNIDNIKYLESERDRIISELNKMEGKTTPYMVRREASPFGKREEEADESLELEKRLIVERNLNETLAEINRALDKHGLNTYGICDVCNKRIEPARLEALPYANLCLSCKSKQAKDNRGRQNR